jgi:dTDP-glucose pyrophosphorylase
MMPTLVLCMAGTYRRFREAGYVTPKFLLPVGDRSVLQLVIEGLQPERLLLVANVRDRPHEEAIREVLALSGVPEAGLCFIGDTSGQAETAAIGATQCQELGWLGPLVFHNIDTVLRGRSLDHIGARLAKVAGFIDVFDSDSAAYSYVTIEAGRVTRIAEKIVISRHATTGLYAFATPAAYLEAAQATTARSAGEFYISDVYETMLARGDVIAAEPATSSQQTIILGTPSEYEQYIAQRAE